MNKRILTLLLAAALAVGYTNAQTGMGVQAGLNLSKFWGSDAPESQYRPGIRLGIEGLTDTKISNLSFAVGILYAQQGGKIDGLLFGEKVNAEMILNSFQFHYNARYTFDIGNDMGVFFQAGPYLGFNFLAKRKTEVDGKWESEKLKIGFVDEGKVNISDIGLGIGAGLKVMNNIQVGVGFNFGFMPIFGGSDWINWYNSNLSFTAAYFFGK